MSRFAAMTFSAAFTVSALLPPPVAYAAPATPATPATRAAQQELPPPGLYRVDSDARIQHKAAPHATTTIHTDGGSGDQVSRSVVAGIDGGRQVARGGAPVTQCVRAGTPALPPALGKAACKTESTTRTKDGVVHLASCPTGKLSLKVRRLDDRTWEYITEMDMSTGSTPNLDGTRTMLEMAARGAAKAQDRAEAARALAELPRMQAGMDRERAGAEAALQQALADARTPQEAALVRQAMARIHGRVPIQTRDRTTLTRIADHCTAP